MVRQGHLLTVPQWSSTTASDATGLRHTVEFGASADAPLLLLVHGRQGTGEVMWGFKRAFPRGVTVLAPQAPLPEEQGFSWWSITAPDRLAQADSACETFLMPFLSRALEFYALSPRVIVAIGFSMGGALLSIAAQRRGERFRGIGILGGFVIDVAHTPTPPPSIFIAHGEQDEVVRVDLAHEGAALLRRRNFPVEVVLDPVGHKVGTGGMRALTGWLAQQLS